MKSFYSTVLLFFLLACNQSQKNENTSHDSIAATPPPTQKEVVLPGMENRHDTLPKKPAVNPYEKANINVKTFQNNAGDVAKGSWGYDLYIDNTLYIHQPSIPAVAGNNGFSSEAKARKAGELVGYKIKHNIMPPAVSPQELDSIGVLH